MINKNTILSAFDDKGTLLIWLKKVEKALKESVLSSVEVIKVTDTRAIIKFIFADNTAITTPEFTLPKGDKGDGVELISSVYYNTPTYIGSSPSGNFNISSTVDFYLANGETVTAPVTFTSSLKGSESVVVDVSEDEKHIEIHLDAEIIAKISRALSLPISAPVSLKIVGIGTDNEQKLLEFDNDQFSINGDKIVFKNILYLHTFQLLQGSIVRNFKFVTTNPMPINSFSTFGVQYDLNLLNSINTAGNQHVIYRVKDDNENIIYRVVFFNPNSNTLTYLFDITNTAVFTDEVTVLT